LYGYLVIVESKLIESLIRAGLGGGRRSEFWESFRDFYEKE
jgi:hypothetical protein